MNAPASFSPYLELRKCLAAWRPDAAAGVVPEWQRPQDVAHGLLTSNVAFRAAKAAGINPVQLAIRLVDDLSAYAALNGLPVRVTTAGPYINVSLSDAGHEGVLAADLTVGLVPTDERRVMLEYIGANVAKRLHAGHMRNLNIGDSLRRLMSLKYPNLVTDNHWGDWGVQFGVLIWAYKLQADEAAYRANTLDELQRLYVWGSAQEGVVDGWRELVRDEFLKLEQGDAENRRLWQEFVAVSKESLKDDLRLMGVPDTDLEQGESYYEADMAALLGFMEANGLCESDGAARFIDFEALAASWTPESPELAARLGGYGRSYLVSSNGYTTYTFRDVAARVQWARDHRIELAVTVTDKTQAHNFDQAFAIAAYLAARPGFAEAFGAGTADRLRWDDLKHVGYGFLQLTTGKMSTRKGNVLRISELVSEVEAAADAVLATRDAALPVAARTQRARAVALASLKWADLDRDPLTDVTLDPAAITRFEGNTGTYQLYTYARLRNVLRRAGAESGSEAVSAGALDAAQRQLVTHLYALPSVITAAVDEYRPNLVAAHCYELADRANRWYVAAPRLIELDAADPVRIAALQLIRQVTLQLRLCLELLGIETIETL